MDTACVKLIKGADELQIYSELEPATKIAIKDGDKYIVRDSNTMSSGEFKENSMYAQVDVPAAKAAEAANDEENESKEVATEGSDFIKYNELHNKGKLSQDEQTELARIQTEHPSFNPPVATDAINTAPAPAGAGYEDEYINQLQSMGNQRPGGKSSKGGRKSAKRGRKSAKRGRKSVKRGRKGKGSRRSKK